MSDPVIASAGQQHIPGILTLNAVARESVPTLDAAGAATALSTAALVLVAERAGELCGYLIAYSSEQPSLRSEFTWFQENRRAFLYLDQIVVAQPLRRRGVGRLLCTHATTWAEACKLKSLVTTANQRPHDAVALAFHRAMGFRQSGELDASDGRRVVLLERRFTSTLQPWKEALSGFHGTSQQQQQ
jgi:predicted GNAT superfamily acetyltransferase